MSIEKVGASGTAPRHIWRRFAVATAFFGSVSVGGLWLAYLHFDRTPGELMRYAERRLIGHPKLEFVILPIFKTLRPLIERPVGGPFPTLGKGQQAQTLSPQRYDNEGRPIPLDPPRDEPPSALVGETITITSASGIPQALSKARSGQIIELAPGTYAMPISLHIHNAGEATRPIVMRAKVPGSVIIESTATEGFHLHAPYWVFENLVIRGTCKEHSNCEHAFHIVGKAQNIVIRNNRIEDFNAHIKVNGLGDIFPDNGLVQFNTLSNTRPRMTANPVTPIDIVAADNWRLADNIISNFVKADGNKISFGAFMKGSGNHGLIERNLVICTTENISQPGNRVGLSLGGGGTDKNACRDKRCITEFSQGAIVDNIIAHCNDFGIYINRASQSRVSANTLANTYGIDVRFPTSSGFVSANTHDGRIRARDDANVETLDNHHHWVLQLPDSIPTR
jgi:parallel beta-helix repeat protein